MPKLHYVKKAAKNYKAHGIKKGMPYYWWKFPRAPKQYSLTKPRRSQLTRSAFVGAMMDLEDEFLELEGGEPIDVRDGLENLASEVASLGEETEGSLAS